MIPRVECAGSALPLIVAERFEAKGYGGMIMRQSKRAGCYTCFGLGLREGGLMALGLVFIMFGANVQAASNVARFPTWQSLAQTSSAKLRQSVRTEGAATPKISEEQASEIARKKVPGEVTGISIEKKQGKNVYVVEIQAKKSGKETDVFVDMDSGKVLGTE